MIASTIQGAAGGGQTSKHRNMQARVVSASSAAAQKLVFANSNAELVVVDLKQKTASKVLPYTNDSSRVSISPAGDHLVASSDNKGSLVMYTKVHNFGRDYLDWDAKLHTHEKGCLVHSVTFSPDNERFFSISCLKGLRIWKRSKNTWKLEQGIPGAYAASFSQKGELMTCARRDKSVQVWKLYRHKWILKQTLRGFSHPIKCISFLSSANDQSGNDCIATVTDHHLNILDARSGRELRSPIALWPMSTNDRRTTRMSCTSSGEYFACGTLHGSLCIWNTRTGLRWMFKISAEQINTVCFRPCGQQLVIAYSNNVRVCDISKVVAWASILMCLKNITIMTAPLARKIVQYALPVPEIYDCERIYMVWGEIYFESIERSRSTAIRTAWSSS